MLFFVLKFWWFSCMVGKKPCDPCVYIIGTEIEIIFFWRKRDRIGDRVSRVASQGRWLFSVYLL